MLIKVQKILFCHLLCFLLFATCTRNPLSESSTITSNERLKVTGKVQLSDGSSPSGVYVWLEGFNISTLTTADGSFLIELPAPQTQPGGGLTGTYRIFYYLGNYQYETFQVNVSEGYFLFGQLSLNSEGEVRNTIVLDKLVDIQTTVEPQTKSVGQRVRLDITIKLRVISGFLNIETIKDPGDTVYVIIAKELGQDYTTARLLPANDEPVTEIVNGYKEWKIYVWTDWILFPDAPLTWEIIPYLRVVQEGLPEELITNIAPHANNYHSDFVNIPFKWNLAQFRVM